MKFHKAKFVLSAPKTEALPNHEKPEFAFIGRSNVGKSSLINRMFNQKNLCKTSSTPGKTQLLNLFEIDEGNWYVTDLPGYGYARVSKDKRKEFSWMIKNYIVNRPYLVNLFMLIDSRHSPMSVDLEFIGWLGQSEIPFSIVFTKTDKLSKQELSKNIDVYKAKLSETWEALPPFFITSSVIQNGTNEVLEYIEGILEGI